VSRDWYLLLPGGEREGPYAEEELLDFLDSGEITPEAPCHHPASGRTAAAGSLFRTLSPVIVAPASPSAPVAWEPAPFPEEKSAAPPRARLLYHGHPCVLCYWRSFLLAGVLAAGGALVRENLPALFVTGLLLAAVVLLRAVLHRMSAHYILTTTRVEVRRGLFAPRSRELRIADIRAVSIHGSGCPGIGTLRCAGPASPADDVAFRNVWRPGRFKVLIRRIQADPGTRR
jgi:hypothetical protein